MPQILAALLIAAEAGLRLPLVYNTGGYDSLETLALLDGVVDIYMPDMKYADADVGRRFSKVADYPAVNQAAVKEMHRQVGDLTMDERGVAQRGLLVRHLVLPEGLAGTAEIVRFLRDEISPQHVYQRDGPVPALLPRPRVAAAGPAHHQRRVRRGGAPGRGSRPAPGRAPAAADVVVEVSMTVDVQEVVPVKVSEILKETQQLATVERLTLAKLLLESVLADERGS